MTAAPSSDIFFISSLVLFALGAAGSLVLNKRDAMANVWGNFLAILGSLSGIIFSSGIFINNGIFSYSAETSFPFLSLSLRVDQLAAFFIFIISAAALAASIYAIGYARHFYQKYNIGVLGFFYNIFIASMLLTVSSHNAIFFLIVWEMMSLASYFLVIFEHKEKENIKAGSLYFVMTHIGTAFIILAFLLLNKFTGSFDFDAIKNNAGTIPLLIKDLIFVFALIGFGAKAGIIPFHIWLPSAHPAAPSHVSALMSGVMIKTAVYMLIRIFMDIMPGIPEWWGILVLVIGSISSLLGVLYALSENNIKKLLAYSSIENIGIIFLGLGSALVFLANDMRSFAALALAASMFHILNHAIFKSLLFFGAGSVISATHTKSMEKYGGLIKKMPQTAIFFLIGSMAISALPPFNGFFSEWMIFQSLFGGLRTVGGSAQWAFFAAAGALAFTGGLAIACFVKAFGISFLARPRSENATHAKEAGIAPRLGMGLLAGLIIVVGFFAGQAISIISKIVGTLSVFESSNQVFSANAAAIKLEDGFAAISPPVIFVALAATALIVFAVVYYFTRERKIRISRTWDCGTTLTPRMEMTSTAFSRSLVTIFAGILKPTGQSEIEYRDADMRYFPKRSAFALKTEDIYNKYLYQPAQSLIAFISERVKMIQTGNVNAYVLYIFLILIFFLVFSVS